MKLTDAIKQTKFSSSSQQALLNIVYVASLIRAGQSRFLKQYDLSPEQYNILPILRGQQGNPASIGLLQDRMLDRMSNASRLVEKLKQKELVSRCECPNDRRQVDVLITEKGLGLLQELDPKIKQMDENLKVLEEGELIQLNAMLDKLSLTIDSIH